MSTEQRAAVNEKLRRPAPAGPQSIEEMRAGFAALMATMRVTSGVTTSPTTLGGRPAVLVEPEGRPKAGTIVYFHGGAYIVGSPETAMSITSALVARTRMRSVSVDYRLAPEHPFPAAVEDALAAYRELLDRGTPSRAIAFAGDSAGGGVAIAACLMVRDAGLPMPACVATFSAGVDATRSGASMDDKAGIDPIFTRERLAPMSALYQNGQDAKQALMSPAVTGDLRGLPPLLLQVGTNEVLLDDSTRLAQRAWAAGVDVILDVTAGVPHVFQTFTGVLEEADEALDRAAQFLTQRLQSTTSNLPTRR